MTKILPTITSSKSEAFFRNLVHMSMVNIVEDELNIEVREDIRAAIITASIKPQRPYLKSL